MDTSVKMHVHSLQKHHIALDEHNGVFCHTFYYLYYSSVKEPSVGSFIKAK